MIKTSSTFTCSLIKASDYHINYNRKNYVLQPKNDDGELTGSLLITYNSKCKENEEELALALYETSNVKNIPLNGTRFTGVTCFEEEP